MQRGIDTYTAATVVYESLQLFVAGKTNPVLMLIPDARAPIEAQHYPTDALNFAGDEFRVYYHSHPREHRIAGEHGHFHYFINAGDHNEWAHLVGLCMDAQGQALRWFTTNHWVTAGTWLDATTLADRLQQHWPQIDDAQLSPIEAWLWGMLGMFSREILALLQQRDSQIQVLGAGQEAAAILSNRALYLLGEYEIDLFGQFKSLLART